MLIVSLTAPDLFVFPTVADAERAIGPKYAESDFRAAFDDAAVPYQVKWVMPNNHRKSLFGLVDKIEPGVFHLVPAGPARPRALIELIESYSDRIRPREARANIALLLEKLHAA